MSKKNSMNVKEFFKKNGLYLCLAVCVLGVGLGVFFGLADKEAPEEVPDQLVDAQQQPDIKKDTVIIKPQSLEETAEPQINEEDKEVIKEEETKKQETASVSSNTLKLKKPLDGEIISSFSGDKLVFNPTLNMWLTHNGIDISAGKSKDVVSALAGEVTKVYSDDTRGMVVEIEHQGSKKTVYCGLSQAGVEEGSLVNAGTLIGKVGTPGFEADRGEHLHFEYIVDGKYADPVKLF